MRGGISENEGDDEITVIHTCADEEHELTAYSTGTAIEMMWRLLLQRAAAVPSVTDATLFRWIKSAVDYNVSGIFGLNFF